MAATKDLYISWTDYHQKIETLAIKIYQSGWNFNQIVCIAKGGLRPGDILCRIYDIPLAIMYATSYGGKNKRIRGKITLAPHLAMTQSQLGDRVLLVDDLVDSGTSLQAASNWLNQQYPHIEEIRTGVIWYKASSCRQPDYYVDYLPDNPWIHQPFEIYENLNIESLSQK
ncbi:MAG: phosphoribosyltransferase [Cyanobacteria bacterium J083]|nr:MAG: phosphoribosyltransferase [Cyanobacteria bacterium J083]